MNDPNCLNPQRLVGTLILLWWSLWTSGCATTVPSPARGLETKVDELFRPWNRPDSPGAAVVVVQGDRVICERGYGCANLEHRVAITSRTVFDAASVAKQFTGLAVAMLIDQSRISLEDDIRRYLPEVPDFGTPVTVRQLLHHTSGLRDWYETLILAGLNPSDLITTETILGMVRRQRELDFAPGGEHSYSNTGYNLLAVLVSRLTGQSFRAWTDVNLFQPLGMAHTHFCYDPAEVVPNRAAYYVSRDRGEWRQFVSQLSAPGSSSLMTTADDMARWLINLGTARVGGTNAIQLMQQPGKLNTGVEMDYGFGLALGQHRGLKNVYHTGSWAGDCAMTWFPEKRLGIAVFANGPGMRPERIVYDIADLYLDLEGVPRGEAKRSARTMDPRKAATAPPSLTSEQMAAYVGDYWSEELQVMYRVGMQDGELTMQHRFLGAGKLEGRGPDRFYCASRPGAPVAWDIEFSRDARSVVNGMKVSGGRIRHVTFKRVVLTKPEIPVER